MEMATRAIWFFGATLGLSAASVLLYSRIAPLIGVIDTPGGRKQHGQAVPLVGGLAIFTALLCGAILVGIAPRASYFLFALSIVIAAGLWDDVADIRPRVKVATQIAACSVMIWGADLQLHTLGKLFGARPIGLWVFSIPMTLFAVIGVVNAINMMDGMDGLAGCVSFAALAWYGVVAIDSGLQIQFNTALMLCGAIAGFLLFNLRLPWQRQAKVFLGDAGSLMIGFALAWFAIDLTQGSTRTFPPVAALWVLLLPLADCVSLLVRRLRVGRSPFVADRHHVHHYLLARGFTHGQTLAILTGASVVFGAAGYFGWRLEVPEPVLFGAFAAVFLGYHGWIARAWIWQNDRVCSPSL